jgi:hypothetical protein
VFRRVYLAIVVVWPFNQGVRFLFPLFPLFVLYAVRGIEVVSAGRRVISLACFAAVAVLYAMKYRSEDFGPMRRGVATRDSVEFFSYLRTRIDRHSVILFVRPALALFGERKSAAFAGAQNPKNPWQLVRSIGATHAALGPIDDPALRQLIARNPQRFQRVFANASLSLFRITPAAP